jgi:uncharacterized protein YfaP (DUF2135 family)
MERNALEAFQRIFIYGQFRSRSVSILARRTKVLQTLFALADQDIKQVSGAVRAWRATEKVDSNANEGRRAPRVAIDLVRENSSATKLISDLTDHLKAKRVSSDRCAGEAQRLVIATRNVRDPSVSQA